MLSGIQFPHPQNVANIILMRVCNLPRIRYLLISNQNSLCGGNSLGPDNRYLMGRRQGCFCNIPYMAKNCPHNMLIAHLSRNSETVQPIKNKEERGHLKTAKIPFVEGK